MRIMTRHILKEFLRILLMTVASLALIAFSIEFLQNIRGLYKYEPEFSLLLKYVLLRLPRPFFEMLPLAVLLSTLLTFGGFAKNNEITAFKSSGISIFRLAIPVLISGVVLSLLSYLLSGTFSPVAYREAKRIKRVEIQKSVPAGGFVQNKIWVQVDQGSLLHLQLISPDKEKMQGVHLYRLNDDFSMSGETEAEELVYEGGEWILINGLHRTFRKDGAIDLHSFERSKIALNKKPEDFGRVSINLKEMTLQNLESYVSQLSEVGLDATRYEVALRGKQALPFVNFMMVLLGIPFSLKDKRSSGIAWGIAISLAMAICYWMVYSVTLALGRSMVFQPWLAAWSANILLLMLGGYLFLNIRQ